MSIRTLHTNGAAAAPSRAERPGAAPLSLGLLPSYLGYHLRRAQRVSFRHFADAVGADEDITPGLFGILQVIAANPGVSQSRVAEAMDIDRSTIVNVVHRFEAHGLVVRMPSARDRRSNALRITAEGRARLRRIEARLLQHEAEFAGILTARERQTLVRLLLRLYARRESAARPRPGRSGQASGSTRPARARRSR